MNPFNQGLMMNPFNQGLMMNPFNQDLMMSPYGFTLPNYARPLMVLLYPTMLDHLWFYSTQLCWTTYGFTLPNNAGPLMVLLYLTSLDHLWFYCTQLCQTTYGFTVPKYDRPLMVLLLPTIIKTATSVTPVSKETGTRKGLFRTKLLILRQTLSVTNVIIGDTRHNVTNIIRRQMP